MSLIKKLIIKLFLSFFICSSLVNAEEIKKVGKYKDWEAVVYLNGVEKVCFAQSKPVLQSPKKVEREARLFVSFRPNEKIVDEVSTTSGYNYNNQNTVSAKSGKTNYKFDIKQEGFAWIADNKIERKIIKTMKKASRIMVTGYNKEGSQTIDHYSLMGFTKAYGAAKKVAHNFLNEIKKKIVLAYSGGLDTSIILKWLQENYDAEVIAYTADVGQEMDKKKIINNAKKLGVKNIIINDLKDVFVKDYVYPMIRGHALYEGFYLLGTSIARPLIAKDQVRIAKKFKAFAVSHGSTGKGNDQVRFELGYYYFASKNKGDCPLAYLENEFKI